MEKIKKLLHKDTCLPVLGPCMITFAIPLLIPGLTLTCVAFSDETGFSKFGALHVLGMLLLIVACFLLIFGCVLNFVVSKKSKGRVSPQDEEDYLSTSSSQSEITGYVHSTHDTKPLERPSTTLGIEQNQKTARSLSDHLDNNRPTSSSDAKDPGTGESSQSSTSETPSPPLGQTSPRQTQASLTPAAAAAVRSSFQGFSTAETSETGTPRNPKSSPRSLNYMSSDSEDENVVATKYAIAAGTLLKDRHGRIRTTSTDSTSSSSSENRSPEVSDAEGGDPGLQKGEGHFSREDELLAQYKQVESSRGYHDRRAMSSNESLRHSTDRSAVDERSDSMRHTTNIQNEKGAGVYAEPLFVTRTPYMDQRQQVQVHVTETESENSDLQDSELQNNSSSSMGTESASQGTYSLKSVRSEELYDAKVSPDGVIDENESRFQPHSSSGRQRLGAFRSYSPKPLKPDLSRNREESTDQCYTVLGNTSGSSIQNSPAKQSLSGSVQFDSRSDDTSRLKTEIDSSPERKKRKKRKKKKKRKNNLKVESVEPFDAESKDDSCRQESEHHLSPSSLSVSPARSPIKSSMHSQNRPYSPRHVHWSDDDRYSN